MINNRKGVTLTEAVVTMVIMGILAGGLLTILGLNATETSEGIANSRVQMQYENFIEQFARDVRRAAFVLTTGETTDNANTLPDSAAKSVFMYDLNDTVIAGYAISGNTLQEGTTMGGMQDYMAGNKPVLVTSSSDFLLYRGRKGVTARIHAKYDYKSASDSIVTNTNYFRCRN